MNNTSISHIHNDKTTTQSKQMQKNIMGDFLFLSFSISFYYLNNFGSNRKNHNLANFI